MYALLYFHIIDYYFYFVDDKNEEILPVFAQNMVNELKCELKAHNRVNNVDYWMNFIRIVQIDNVELIFKLVPCPPKGQVLDFYFEHPIHCVHWHYKIFSKNIVTLSRRMVTKGRDYVLWDRYATLEDDASLFLLRYRDKEISHL